MTRAFVAVPMPEEVAAMLSRLARGLPVGRRVREENLHLTLAFLGEVSDDGLEEAHGALAAIRAPPIELRFEGLGVFGESKPRALYAALAPAPALVELRQSVVRALRRAGLAPEARRFVPHVTLARFRGFDSEAVALAAFLTAHGGAGIAPVRVVAFSLMSSRLRPDGAVYEELALYPLIG